MIIFPAIDIRGGKCVRLTEGDFAQETVYADNPVDMAKRWEREGAEFLHLVDLDGAVAGKPVNLNIIKDIVRSVNLPTQLGGGIRSLETVKEILASGVTRVILGSVAVRQPELVKTACAVYGEKIVVGIDARNGQVAVEGWGANSNVSAGDLAEKMAAAGVSRIIYTDISRDGTLTGVNKEETEALALHSGISVIASGGVGGLGDIKALASARGIEGVIVGKALYAGALTLQDAVKAARGG